MLQEHWEYRRHTFSAFSSSVQTEFMLKMSYNCKGNPALTLVTELDKGTCRASTCKTLAKPDEHDVRCFSAFFKLEQFVKLATKVHLEKEAHFSPALNPCSKMLEHQSSLNKRSPEFVWILFKWNSRFFTNTVFEGVKRNAHLFGQFSATVLLVSTTNFLSLVGIWQICCQLKTCSYSSKHGTIFLTDRAASIILISLNNNPKRKYITPPLPS